MLRPPVTSRIFITPLSIDISWTCDLSRDIRGSAGQAIGGSGFIFYRHIHSASLSACGRCPRVGLFNRDRSIAAWAKDGMADAIRSV